MKKTILFILLALLALPFTTNASGFTLMLYGTSTVYKRGEMVSISLRHPPELVGREVVTTVGLVKPGDIIRFGGTMLYRTAFLTNGQETIHWQVPADFRTDEYELVAEEHPTTSPTEVYFDWVGVRIDPLPASVLMLYSPLEIFRGNTAKFKFAVTGAPSENFVLGVLKKDGVALGWIINVAELSGEQGEINWDFSQYLTPDLGEYRIAPAGDGYSIQIGVAKDYIGLNSRPTDPGLFVVSAETARFKILPNTSNLFIRHTRSSEHELLSFAVLGQPGEQYSLQESADLISWGPLSSPTGLEGEKVKPGIQVESFGLGKLTISRDNQLSGNRFYRAVLLGP